MKSFAVIALSAGLIWAGIYALSSHIADQPTREHQQIRAEQQANATTESKEQHASVEPVETSAETKQLIETANQQRQDVAAQVAAGDALLKESNEKRDPQMMMQAISFFTQALSLDPKHQRSLLVMGNLSFDVGMFERAAHYFERYREQDNEDPKVLVDLALSYLGADKQQEALSILQDAQERFPKDFPVRISLALTYQRLGNLDEARNAVRAAKEVAPDDTAKSVADSLLQQIEEHAKMPATAAAQTAISEEGQNADTATTADQFRGEIETFFREHQIIGPKIVGMDWNTPSGLQVSVQQFPVAAMPEFAKTILREKIGALVTSHKKSPFSVAIVESGKPDSKLEFEY